MPVLRVGVDSGCNWMKKKATSISYSSINDSTEQPASGSNHRSVEWSIGL